MNTPHLLFEPIIIPKDTDAFTGAFISQNSYCELLDLVDSYFSLDMRTPNRRIPCVKHSYMLISKDPRHVWVGVGKKFGLKITKLLCNDDVGIVVAFVHLKHNFTCNDIPHIVIAKQDNINRATVNSLISSNSPTSYVVQLPEPYSVHGRIGALLGSGEELALATDIIENNMPIQKQIEYVARPETVLTVEQPDPEPEKVVSVQEYTRRQIPTPKHQDDLQITLDDKDKSTNISMGAVATGEVFKGCPVMKGPRGGQYIMKDDKKIYVNTSSVKKGTVAKSGAVYKVNMLS